MSIKVKCVGRDTPYFIIPLKPGLGFEDNDYLVETASIVVFDCTDMTIAQKSALSKVIPKLKQALPQSSIKTGKAKSIAGDRTCIQTKADFSGTLFPNNWKVEPAVTIREYTPDDFVYREGTCLPSGLFGGKTLYNIRVPLINSNGEETGSYHTLASNVVAILCIDRRNPGSSVLKFEIGQGSVSYDDNDDPVINIAKATCAYAFSWNFSTFSMETDGVIPRYDAGLSNGTYHHSSTVVLPSIRSALNREALVQRIKSEDTTPRLGFMAEVFETPGVFQDEDSGNVTAVALTSVTNLAPHIPSFDTLSYEGRYVDLALTSQEGRGFSGQDYSFIDPTNWFVEKRTLDGIRDYRFMDAYDYRGTSSQIVWIGLLSVSTKARITAATPPADDLYDVDDISLAALQRVFRHVI